jgi:hypothetical protein
MWALKMTDLLTIRQTMRTSWLTAHAHAARAALWSEHHPFVALGLLYGMLVYLGFAVLAGVPGQAVIALMVVGPVAWWGIGRYAALTEPQTPRLNFFTWDDGPLRLSEDILSSKIVYCVGVKNESTKIAGRVRVNIDSVEGCPGPATEASLPIFRSPDNSVDLQPDEAEYFCVMRRMDGATEDDARVAICCHDNLTTPSFGVRELVDGRTVTLSARSEGAPRTTKQIQISSKRDAYATWSLHLKLIPNAEEVLLRVAEHRPVARPYQVKEASDRMRAGLCQVGELFCGLRGRKGFAHDTSERTERSQRTRSAHDVLQAVRGKSLDKGAELDAFPNESPAQSERIRKLLERQARA